MKSIDTHAGPADIIHEDNDIVAISKPHRLHTVEDRFGKEEETVRSLLTDIYGSIFIVHRLDAGTGGILVAAKNAKTHSMLCRQFEAGTVEKSYAAVVQGSFAGAVTVMLPISSKPGHGKFKINFKSGKHAATTFMPIETAREASFVEAIPLTGRTHQIRVHLKALKTPLYYDWLYNPQPDMEKGRLLSLFARSIKFIHPKGYTLELEAPLSEFMEKCRKIIKN